MYSGYTTPVAYTPWKASIEDILNDEIVSSDKDILPILLAKARNLRILTSISQKKAFSTLTYEKVPLPCPRVNATFKLYQNKVP